MAVPFLDFFLLVISKGTVSSASPTCKRLLFSTFLVLFLQPQLFLEKMRQQLIMCLNADRHVKQGLIAKEKTALSDVEVVWQEQEKVSSRAKQGSDQAQSKQCRSYDLSCQAMSMPLCRGCHQEPERSNHTRSTPLP